MGSLARHVAARWPLPVLVKVAGGCSMYVDLRSSIGRGLFATGTFDSEAIAPALAALAPGATYIDIGANVGFYAILARQTVGASGTVHCFEMDPRPLRMLRKTVARFGYTNIEINHAAVSNKNGEVFFAPAADHGHSRIVPGGGTRAVRSVTLDAWAAARRIARVDVIKIDVEGAEMLVLEGASEVISAFRPLILCEAADETTKAFGYEPADLITFLENHGYTTAWLSGVHTPTLVARWRRAA
jgi:FkbM family methyltransferase